MSEKPDIVERLKDQIAWHKDKLRCALHDDLDDAAAELIRLRAQADTARVTIDSQARELDQLRPRVQRMHVALRDIAGVARQFIQDLIGRTIEQRVKEGLEVPGARKEHPHG